MRTSGRVSLAGSPATSLVLSLAPTLAASFASCRAVARMPLLVRGLMRAAWCDICCRAGVWS
jgi:hypothetical protein